MSAVAAVLSLALATPADFPPLDIDPPPAGVSIYDRDADLRFRLEYPALAGYSLQARGLAFRKGPDDWPEPVRDPPLRLDGNPPPLLALTPGALGDAPFIRATTFRLTDAGFEGWEGGACVRLTVVAEVGSLGVGPGLVVRAAVRARPGAATLERIGPWEGSVPLALPLGATGVVLRGGTVSFEPATGEVTLGTRLTPAGGGDDGVALAVRVRFRPGHDARITYEGDLEVGRHKLGHVAGTWSAREVSGTLSLAGGGDLVSAPGRRASFRLDASGLEGVAEVVVLEGLRAEGRLWVGRDGAGRFESRAGVRVLGGELGGTVGVSFAPGFRDAEVKAELNFDLSRTGKPPVRANVGLLASRRGVAVTGSAGGRVVQFRAPRLEFRLADEVRTRLASDPSGG